MATKLITVFGATGKQGGSVVNGILADSVLSNEFKIRGITRDTSKPAAQELVKRGVEMKTADMDSPESLTAAIEGSHTVFLVTNYWESEDFEKEYTQGKNVADASKAANVSHLIFSSLVDIAGTTAGKFSGMKHFQSKAKVEEYIREIAVPATFFLAGYFMSNFSLFMKKGDDGVYTVALPVSDKAQFPLIDIGSDAGKIIAAAIKKRDTFLGKRIYGAVDYYTPKRIMDEFTEVTGHPAKFVHIPGETFQSFLSPTSGAELLENHQLLDVNGYYAGASLDGNANILDEKLTTWKEFVAKVPEWK